MPATPARNGANVRTIGTKRPMMIVTGAVAVVERLRAEQVLAADPARVALEDLRADVAADRVVHVVAEDRRAR